MRPCPHCRQAIGNAEKVCPHCEAEVVATVGLDAPPPQTSARKPARESSGEGQFFLMLLIPLLVINGLIAALIWNLTGDREQATKWFFGLMFAEVLIVRVLVYGGM